MQLHDTAVAHRQCCCEACRWFKLPLGAGSSAHSLHSNTASRMAWQLPMHASAVT
jgi:hypothetical protein